MLIQLVERTCQEIERIDDKAALPQLVQQVGSSAPDTVRRFANSGQQPASEETAALVLASVALVCVKAVPNLAGQLLQRVNDGRLPAARRCGVASLLAYLVQPHDLIHDALPAGYGYLDDAILLRAGIVHYLDTLPEGQQSAEAESQVVGFLMNLTPPAVRPLLEQAVGTMSLSIQLFSMMEPGIAELAIQQMMANPLQAAAPAAPQGFVPQAPRNFQQGFWGRSGAYIEGDNFIMPGGGGLINGEVFIP